MFIFNQEVIHLFRMENDIRKLELELDYLRDKVEMLNALIKAKDDNISTLKYHVKLLEEELVKHAK